MYVFSTCVGSHTSSQNHRVLLAGSSFSGAHAHICVITHGVCKPLQILACVCECMCTSMSPAAALHRHPRVRQRRRQEEGEDHARGRMARTTRKRASKRRGHLGNLFLCRSARHAEAVHWVCRQGTAQAEATTYHTTRYDSKLPRVAP
ncbi:unnamed protein product [Prorocentrum cordatum]|uniref:Uncharacterized protein n=1 Tax=Prorocentrum cordatum TaxID=2364126 RepID=A0ABN9S2Y3_9DINO|nr:unnamed protein product [Polarella glacialis]